MTIDTINSAMTPLQFASARAGIRTVENAASSTNGSRGAGSHGRLPSQDVALRSGFRTTAPLLPATTLRFTYRPIPGTSAARRTPQVADTNFWSFSLNRMG